MLSLRVSRDKRGYDHIYLLLESRRKGRTVTRLLYGGRWPSPMKIGCQPLDEATRKTLEQAHPDVIFDWNALQRTLQQALATPRAPMTPEGRRRAAGRGGEGRDGRESREGREGREGRPPSSGPGGGPRGPDGRPPHQGSGRVPPGSRPQMPPRQRPPYGSGSGASGYGGSGYGSSGYGSSGFGDQAEQDRRSARHTPDARTLDDTADLPFRGGGDGHDPDPESDVIDTVDLPIQPYDEPVLEEGLDTEARRGGMSDLPNGPEEIEPVEERTFVVSSGGEETGDHALVADEPVESGDAYEPHDPHEPPQIRGQVERATFERPEHPGPGFTRDEFPVAASPSDLTASDGSRPEAGAGADPSAPPRRRRRRRRGGRRAHGGPNAASQAGDGTSSDATGDPGDSDPGSHDGPDGHDED